jgi:peptidyl-prolyl cis-trans isomerase SurA
MRIFQVLAAALALFLVTTLGGYAATVKVTVNGTEITDLQISSRASLMKLERRGTSNSDRLKLASKELVDEALMLAEAKRVGVEVSDEKIEEAFINVGRSVKLSSDKLTKFLTGSGVNPQTLKDRLKANIAWTSVVQMEVAPRVNVSDLELEKQALDQIEDSLSYDYILKEVRFIVPQGGKVSVSSRTAQANQYRKSFQGCESAVDLSLSYTDVAVLDIGRRHSTQLPEALAKELAGLNIGQITKPRVAEGGVSMLAVCAKASARDTTFIKNDLRQKTGTAEFEKEVAAFLETLRGRASIVYK